MSQPNYVDRGGDIVFSQPFEANGVHFFGFMLNADIGKLQALCDEQFNNPSGGKVSIKPAGPYVLLVFCQLDELKAKTEPFSHYGAFQEGECAIWLMTIDENRDRIFWSFPYIWVDNEYAMAMGRELYGFNKGMAKFSMPASASEASDFSMKTLAVPKFGAAAQGEEAELIRVRRTSLEGGSTVWSGLREGAAAVWGLFERTPGILKDFRLAFHELQDAIHGRVPFIFLKQFRDVADGSKACYQSMIEVPCGMTKFGGGGLLKGEYEVDILDCDSHPIRADLGLDPGPIKPEMCFWSEFNFEIGNGTEIWKAE